MRILNVPIPGHEYNICIEPGLLKQAGDLCREVLSPSARLFIVTDENVAPLYAAPVEESLQRAGFATHTLVLPAGESTKSLSWLEYLYTEMTAKNVTRTDAVVALGGGVMGDLAGLAAATILRGIDFVQIPTTLLAQVDSSVGGKVAIDLPAGKNLVGAFYQPKIVLIDPLVLNTLNDAEFACGMAEVIKYGCIRDAAFFRRLEQAGSRAAVMADIEAVLTTCCTIKAEVVTEDEKEAGLRRILNFGHTLGHAYELAYHYETYTHGQAVAAGMCLAAELGVKLKVTPPEVLPRLYALVRQFGLPERIHCTPEDYRRAVALDKKAEAENITLVLLSGLGETALHRLSQTELMALLPQVLPEGEENA